MDDKQKGVNVEQHFNECVANLIADERCRCDDGSCDWCQIYYATDENLALIISSHTEVKSAGLLAALERIKRTLRPYTFTSEGFADPVSLPPHHNESLYWTAVNATAKATQQ